MAEPARDDRGDRDVWSAVTDPDDEGAAAGPEPGPEPESGRGGQPEPGGPAAAGQRPAPGEHSSAGEPPELAGGPERAGGVVEGVPVRPGIREVTPGRRSSRPVHPSRYAPQRPEPRRAPQPPGTDLLDGLQRWLIRNSAKTMRRELKGQVRRTLGSGRSEPDDVWGTATTEPPGAAAEAPECAWCPICRAARRMRESGPGLSSHISGVSEAVAAAVQDAMTAVDGVLSRTAEAPGHEPPPDRSPGSGRADPASDPAERATDEPGDRS
jgi:hypothetical protein